MISGSSYPRCLPHLVITNRTDLVVESRHALKANTQIITDHRERLWSFLVHKGGIACQESVERFRNFMLTLAAKPTPAGYTIQALRDKYLAFPESTTYGQMETKLNADTSQSVLDILRGADFRNVRFPVGGGKPASLIDIGCAEGQKTSALAEAWGLPRHHAVGHDFVPATSPPSNIDFQMMSPNFLPKRILYNSQDLAIVSMVFHHSSDP